MRGPIDQNYPWPSQCKINFSVFLRTELAHVIRSLDPPDLLWSPVHIIFRFQTSPGKYVSRRIGNDKTIIKMADEEVSPHPVYVVDAFTDKPFGGNPAAVCLVGSKVS